VVLRSGTVARQVTPLRVFERTWARADHWAIVVLPAGQLPATAEEFRYLQSVAPLEHQHHYEQATTAYAATLARWPNSLGALIGLGNSRYALGDRAGAEIAFRQAVRDHPNAAVALNNLAQTLADRGALTDAEPLAARAVALDPGNTVYRTTLAEIRARAQAPPR